MSQIQILILPNPSSKYSELEVGTIVMTISANDRFFYEQFSHIRKFLKSGGNVLVLLSEGGERKSGSNINFLLEEFGVSVNSGERRL